MRSPGSVGVESPDGISKCATSLRLRLMENLRLVFEPTDNPGDDFVVVAGVRLLLRF